MKKLFAHYNEVEGFSVEIGTSNMEINVTEGDSAALYLWATP